MDTQPTSGASAPARTPPAPPDRIDTTGAGATREPAAPSSNGAGAAHPGPPPGRPRHRRALVVAGLVVVLAAAAIALFRPSPLEVEVGSVMRGPLEVTVDAEGVTRVRDLYQVAAPVGGRVSRVSVREGDRVEPGTEVARITPAPLDRRAIAQAQARLAESRAALQEARARVVQSRAAYEQAERDARRARVLEAAGATSRMSNEHAELDRITAERGLRAAESLADAAGAEVAAARAGLLDADPERSPGQAVSIVRSPVAGRVLRVHEPSERVVPPGTPLVDLADSGRLEVVADVLSTDAVGARAGGRVRILDWGGGEIDGRVRLVEPSGFTKVSALGVEEQRVNVVTDLLRVPAGLGDGYRVEVRIVTWSAPDVLKVPVSALVRRGGGWAVFVMEKGRARFRPITVGHRGADEAEVLGGVRGGETVILFPPDRLEAGMRVRGR